MKKENLNQNGEAPTDKPGPELVKPAKKGKRYISANKEGFRNSTAKDPKLGNDQVTR